jgi:integrase
MSKVFVSPFHDKRNDTVGLIIRKQGKEARLSTGRKVPQKYWNRNRAIGAYKPINEVLAQMKKEIEALNDSHYLKGQNLTAKEIKQAYCDQNAPKDNSFLALQALFLADLKTKIGKKLTLRSWQQRERIAKHTTAFLESLGKAGLPDFEMKTAIARQYENWLIAQNYKNDYIARHTDQLIEVLDFGVVMEKIAYNPLNAKTFEVVRDKQGNPDSLTIEQVKIMVDCFDAQSIASKPLQKANDLFVLGCFLGLNYADLLTYDYLQHTVVLEGEKIMVKARQKTKIEAIVPIAPIVEKILVHYEYQLPLFGDHVQVFNRFLKQVFAIHGIDKAKISSKLARSTFGNLLLNSDDASFEDVAKMMGHGNSNTTKTYYAQVSKLRILRNSKKISYLNQ